MTNIEDGSRAHAAHGSGDVRANSGLAFANLTHLPHLPHLPSKNSCGYEEDPTSGNARGERATVDQGLFIAEDGMGEATLWRRGERHPVPLCRQSDVAAEVWALILAALSVAPQPEPDDDADAAEDAQTDLVEGVLIHFADGLSERKAVETASVARRIVRVLNGTAEPPASDEPARCEHGQTEGHRYSRDGVYVTCWCPGPVAPQPQPDEQRAMEADAMLEPSPSAMLAGIHVTRYRPQDCACRGRHEHRYGYTQDCAVLDCTCVGASS